MCRGNKLPLCTSATSIRTTYTTGEHRLGTNLCTGLHWCVAAVYALAAFSAGLADDHTVGACGALGAARHRLPLRERYSVHARTNRITPVPQRECQGGGGLASAQQGHWICVKRHEAVSQCTADDHTHARRVGTMRRVALVSRTRERPGGCLQSGC